MMKTSRDRSPRRSVFMPGFTFQYTCLTRLNHSVTDILRRIFFTFHRRK